LALTRTDTLWQLALGKWAEIGAASPDLAPAIDLQKVILRLLVDALDALDIPSGSLLSTETVLDKWQRGIPALRNEPVPIADALINVLPPLCDALAAGGAGDSAAHIGQALAKREIDGGSLLRVSLARNRKAIRSSALHHGFAPDLVWVIGELGSSPLAYAAARSILDSMDGISRVPPELWDRGYCPCCGSWPAFIETVNSEPYNTWMVRIRLSSPAASESLLDAAAYEALVKE